MKSEELEVEERLCLLKPFVDDVAVFSRNLKTDVMPIERTGYLCRCAAAHEWVEHDVTFIAPTANMVSSYFFGEHCGMWELFLLYADTPHVVLHAFIVNDDAFMLSVIVRVPVCASLSKCRGVVLSSVNTRHFNGVERLRLSFAEDKHILK